MGLFKPSKANVTNKVEVNLPKNLSENLPDNLSENQPKNHGEKQLEKENSANSVIKIKILDVLDWNSRTNPVIPQLFTSRLFTSGLSTDLITYNAVTSKPFLDQFNDLLKSLDSFRDKQAADENYIFKISNSELEQIKDKFNALSSIMPANYRERDPNGQVFVKTKDSFLKFLNLKKSVEALGNLEEKKQDLSDMYQSFLKEYSEFK